MASTGSAKNTAVGDIVSISCTADGPFGLVLQPDPDGCAAVIQNWARLPNGKFGPVQKHGGVHIGDALFAINDTKLSELPYADVKALLSNRNILQKSLKFMKYEEYMRQKKGRPKRQSSALGTKESKNQFLSVIRRSRINNFTSAKFVEYEVVCQLRLSSGKIEKDKVFKWCVWKRYSDFEQLHAALRRSLGWHMESIEFPSPHNFVMNKFAPDFTEARREDLNTYWQRVIAIDKIAEFNKHHCSEALKLFLDVDGALRGGGEKQSADDDQVEEGTGLGDAEGGGADTPSDAPAAAKKSNASSRRLSTRASSRKMGRRGSSTGNIGGTSGQETEAAPPAEPSPSQSQVAVANAPAPAAPPPPPPPRKASAPTAAAKPAAAPPAGVPKPTPARMNLLGDINKLRKE